jgi:hypothetical protein
VKHRLNLSQDDIDRMETDNAIPNQLKSVYQRGDPDDTINSVTYTIRHFTYHASVIWASSEYMDRLREGVRSSKGLSLFFNTYRFNIIQPESPYVQFSFTELQFKEDPALELKRKDKSVVGTLHRGVLVQ